jgi:ribose transport system substrate-binding protein
MAISRFLGAAAAMTAVVVLSACGGTDDTAADTPADSGPSSSSPVAAEVEAARAEVTNFSTPTVGFDASALRGKTVYYIPITLKAESFQIVNKSLVEAFQSVGVAVQACDGGANPSTAAACLNQALAAHAAGVIADALPVGLAANAFAALRTAKIPVLIVNQLRPAGQTDDKLLAYEPGNAIQMQNMAAKWIAVDSGGSAKILTQEFTDSPNTIAYLEDNAFKTLREVCGGCKNTVNKVSSANFSLIPSSTSSALLRNPDTNYLWTEFDTILQPTMAGVQQAGALAKVKGVSTNGLLGGLQLLRAKNYLYADVAAHYNFQAWVNADAIMRLALGLDVPADTPIPLRVFDRTNIDQVKNLDAAGEQSGEWFGPTTYKDVYTKLWSGA